MAGMICDSLARAGLTVYEQTQFAVYEQTKFAVYEKTKFAAYWIFWRITAFRPDKS